METMNMELKPGSVVCAKYGTFRGADLIGIFLVLYTESNDSSLMYKDNVTALKVSTSLNQVANYVCPISAGNAFFDRDCFACCSKVHTLSKQYQIYKKLGDINQHTLLRVYDCYENYQHELSRQIRSCL